MVNDKIILVHKGALGDFLILWPCLLALVRRHGPERFVWAGRESCRPWTDPLGLAPCPPGLRPLLDRLYSEPTPPGELASCQILWFGLARNPLEAQGGNLTFIPGVVPGLEESPRRHYARGLGLDPDLPGLDWAGTFRAMFGSPDPGRGILLFPGAGHRSKCWPLVQYFELASGLARDGLSPTFVLGPAETGRGLDVPEGWAVARPADFQALSGLLNASAAVVGNDCGPMHLAGMLGRPGLVLFGPTSPRQWGPAGLEVLTSGWPCAPCAATADVSCESPECLSALSSGAVRQSLDAVLSARRPGSR